MLVDFLVCIISTIYICLLHCVDGIHLSTGQSSGGTLCVFFIFFFFWYKSNSPFVQDAYNARTEELKQKSETGGVVSRNKASQELAIHLSEDPLPLRYSRS